MRRSGDIVTVWQTSVNHRIRVFEQTLMDGVALRVYVILGDRFAVMVDTGMVGYEDIVTAALAAVREHAVPLAFIVNTHAHHDHIGLNQWVQQRTGAKILSHPWGRRWIADPDLNFQEFVLRFPHIISDSPALQREVRATLGPGVPLDIAVTDCSYLYPGGVTIQFVETSGHVPGEIGVLIPEDRTLILGDALTGLSLKFFHGHVSPVQYRTTLRRLRKMAREGQVDTILSIHLPPWQGVDNIIAAIQEREDELDQLDDAVLMAVSQGISTLPEIWQVISRKWDKTPEFRGLTMVSAHLEELVADRRLSREGEHFSLLR